MFTPARIAALVGVFCSVFVASTNDRLHWVAIATLAAVSAVAQAIQAFTGPVQNTNAENAISKEAVAQSKGQ